MNKTNIVLVGMPGAGKSTIGVLLAKAMKKTFIDSDLLIQERENKFLQDIIDNQGIKRFLKVEEEILVKLNVKNHVIATGGSAIYSNSAMNHLKRDSIIVYLQLRFDEIDERLSNISSRGIAMSKDQSLMDLYHERIPLYEKHADVVINCSNKHIEDIVKEIKDIVSID